jgi:hypothetical protein
MATGEGRLTIARDSAYVDRARAYKIMVDGKEVGRIKNNTSQTISVPGGSHELFLKVDWATSPTLTFEVNAGEEVRYVCRPTANAFLAVLYSFFNRRNYLTLEPEGSSS